MSRFILLMTCILASLSLSGCITPNATGPYGHLYTPKPPEADQYSDFLIGRYATLTHQSELAAETAQRAYKKTPENSFLLERAVVSLLLAGKTKDAVDLAEFGLTKVTDIGTMTRLTIVAEEFRKKDYSEALFRLRNGEFDVFNRMVARSLSGWAAVGVGDPEAAKTYMIESLVGDNLFDGVNLFMLAFIYESTDQRQEALKTFQVVWKERMRLAVAAEQYARLLAATGDTKTAKAIVAQFRSDIGPSPGVDDLATRLDAGEVVTPMKVSPRKGAALGLFSIGSALASQTESELTTVYFQLALHIDPELDAVRSLLSQAHRRAERLDDAFNTLKEISPRSVYYATSRSQMAWVRVDQNKNDDAVKIVEAAYKETRDRDLAIQAGNMHFIMENYTEALTWFQRVIDLDKAEGKESWRTFYSRGLVLDSLDRWDEAEADLLKSIELDPNKAEVLNYLGYSWVDRGENLEKAFEFIKKAVALRPDSGAIIDSLGWAYFRLGKFDLAVRYLESAASLGTSDPVINDHLGDAYWRTGRFIEAKYQWNHALKLETDPDKAAELKAKLENGLDAAKPVTPVKVDDTTAAKLP